MRKPFARALTCAVLALWFALLPAARAHADGASPAGAAPPSAEPEDEAEVFRYVEPVSAYPLRAAFEELGILALGAAYYFSNHDNNSSNFDFEYKWGDLGEKVTEGYAFDMNRFDTNYLTHPGAGTLYYWAARGNRLSPPVSFLYTLTASTLWEFFGEFRERTSVNDLIATPISGLVLGETTLQIGAFFDRSCANTGNRVFGALFSPFKAAHDAIDGAERLRDTDCDRHGLSRRGDHEFRVSLSEALVVQAVDSDEDPYLETQLALRMRVIALRRFGTPGEGVHAFADGNWSELAFRGAFAGGGVIDFGIDASSVPFGLHYRDIDRSAMFGHEVLFGLLIGVEYARHRYDGGSLPDRYFVLDVPGVGLRYLHYAGSMRWAFELHASPSFGGIDTFALNAYLDEGGSIDDLGSTTRRNGYDHVGGFMLAPRVRLTTPHLELGADFKTTQLWGITALDRYPERRAKVDVREALRRGTLWISCGPLWSTFWPRLWGSALQRWGAVANTHAERVELRAGLGVDAVF